MTKEIEKQEKTEALALRKSELEIAKLEMDTQKVKQELAIQRANFLVQSGILPEGLRDPGTAMILDEYADRTGYPFMAVAQNACCVKGSLSFMAKFVAACVEKSDAVDGRLHYETGSDHETNTWENLGGKVEGTTGKSGKNYNRAAWAKSEEDGLYVIVSGTIAGEDDPEEMKVYLTQATVRNSTLWANDPATQLKYFATKRWASINCPGVILGMDTPDDIIQVNEKITVEPSKKKGPAGLKDRMKPKVADAEIVDPCAEIEGFYGAGMPEIVEYFAALDKKHPFHGLTEEAIIAKAAEIMSAGDRALKHFDAWRKSQEGK